MTAVRSQPLPPLVAVTDDDRIQRPDYLARLEELVAAGCPAIWLRAKRMPAGAFLSRALEASERCRPSGTELWIGDRADVARLVGADALQLSGRGLPVAAARRVVGEHTRVGRSVHGIGSSIAAANEGADYLVVGTIFASASHPGIEPAGADRLREVGSALERAGRSIPLLGIGGMTPERAASAITAGAAGVAALRALWEAERPEDAVAAFLEALGDTSDEALH